MVDVERVLANRGHLRRHEVVLMLSDAEWERVQADAKEIGVSPGQMLSLVCALAAIGGWNIASCLALADVYQYPHRP